MNIRETIGMLSTGALIALGASHFLGGGNATQPAAQPLAYQSASPSASAAAGADPETVTRARSTDLTSLGGAEAAARLQQIVARSQQSLRRTSSLTPEQEEAITFFERLARQHNQSDRSDDGSVLRFSNMAVDQLTVKYFFRIDAPFWSFKPEELDDVLTQHVAGMLCDSEAVRRLMSDYGFSYEYFYVASDDRLVARKEANAGFCA